MKETRNYFDYDEYELILQPLEQTFCDNFSKIEEGFSMILEIFATLFTYDEINETILIVKAYKI